MPRGRSCLGVYAWGYMPRGRLCTGYLHGGRLCTGVYAWGHFHPFSTPLVLSASDLIWLHAAERDRGFHC